MALVLVLYSFCFPCLRWYKELFGFSLSVCATKSLKSKKRKKKSFLFCRSHKIVLVELFQVSLSNCLLFSLQIAVRNSLRTYSLPDSTQPWCKWKSDYGTPSILSHSTQQWPNSVTDRNVWWFPCLATCIAIHALFLPTIFVSSLSRAKYSSEWFLSPFLLSYPPSHCASLNT